MSEKEFVQRVKTYVKGNEGYKNYVYKDSLGYLSMGYGHKLTEEEKKKYKLGDIVDDKLLEEHFEKDWRIHYAAAQKIEGFNSLIENQKEVLIDLTFNMGVTWADKFPNMIKNISLAATADTPTLQQRYISLAAAELKYKNFNKEDFTLTNYWNQTKSRAVRNFDKLLGDYTAPSPLNYGSYDSEMGIDMGINEEDTYIKDNLIPGYDPNDATFGRKGY